MIEESAGSENQMLGLETLTLAPIDLTLVDRLLLLDHEVTWLNNYHSRVFETHSKHLNQSDREWLKQTTRAI